MMEIFRREIFTKAIISFCVPPLFWRNTAEAAPGIVEGGEQGHRHVEQTRHRMMNLLVLGRFRLKTCSKSDFSIAETTWSTYYLDIYLCIRVPGITYYEYDARVDFQSQSVLVTVHRIESCHTRYRYIL